MDILTATNTAVSTLKLLYEMASKIGNRELLTKITELQGGIIETQQQALSLIDNNRTSRAKIEELEKELKLIHEMDFKDGIYWRKGEGIEDIGPFCPICLDRERKAIHLHSFEEGFRCHSCNFITKGAIKISPMPKGGNSWLL